MHLTRRDVVVLARNIRDATFYRRLNPLAAYDAHVSNISIINVGPDFYRTTVVTVRRPRALLLGRAARLSMTIRLPSRRAPRRSR